MPTKRRGCCAVPRTPASPTMPIAKLTRLMSVFVEAGKAPSWPGYIYTDDTRWERSKRVGERTRGKGSQNGKSLPSSQTRQADAQTRAELDEGSIEWEFLGQAVGDEDTDDEAVDTNDTGHDDGDDVYRSPKS